MSISLRAGCLAEPFSANVVSSLQDGDLCGADKGSEHGGAQRRIWEVTASETLQVTWLPPSPSDLSRVESLLAATCASLSLQTDHVFYVFVHWRCLLSQYTSRSNRLRCPEEAVRGKNHVPVCLLPAFFLWSSLVSDQQRALQLERQFNHGYLLSIANPPS